VKEFDSDAKIIGGNWRKHLEEKLKDDLDVMSRKERKNFRVDFSGACQTMT
jgi:hypothetical protein